ncbi:MAG: hypothetical protein GWO24_30675, partial [Akkermansiaceae bacterium]|nr:hypothetical protein [Akkermansiaceae bacterium]
MNSYGYGTFRFTGRARDGNEDLGWTLILKALGGRGIDAEMLDPENWSYWKREILAYRSGMLTDLPDGLGTPRCYGVIEQPGDEFWIWLEDVRDDIEGAWPLERFALAARHLGRFNGAYLTGHPIPNAAWLTRGRVRNWMKIAEPLLRDLPAIAKRPR